jgi:hypothetical protein
MPMWTMAPISRLTKFRHSLTLTEPMLSMHPRYILSLLVLLKDVYNLYYCNSENRSLREDRS